MSWFSSIFDCCRGSASTFDLELQLQPGDAGHRRDLEKRDAEPGKSDGSESDYGQTNGKTDRSNSTPELRLHEFSASPALEQNHGDADEPDDEQDGDPEAVNSSSTLAFEYDVDDCIKLNSQIELLHQKMELGVAQLEFPVLEIVDGEKWVDEYTKDVNNDGVKKYFDYYRTLIDRAGGNAPPRETVGDLLACSDYELKLYNAYKSSRAVKKLFGFFRKKELSVAEKLEKNESLTEQDISDYNEAIEFLLAPQYQEGCKLSKDSTERIILDFMYKDEFQSVPLEIIDVNDVKSIPSDEQLHADYYNLDRWHREFEYEGKYNEKYPELLERYIDLPDGFKSSCPDASLEGRLCKRCDQVICGLLYKRFFADDGGLRRDIGELINAVMRCNNCEGDDQDENVFKKRDLKRIERKITIFIDKDVYSEIQKEVGDLMGKDKGGHEEIIRCFALAARAMRIPEKLASQYVRNVKRIRKRLSVV